MLDVVRRLHGGAREADQVAGEHGVLLEVAAVLLACCDDQGGAGAAGVEEADETVGEAGRDVEADEGGAAGGSGIAVGHGHDRAFVDAEDVLRGVLRLCECGQEGEFGGARVAEDAVHALVAQDVQDSEGGTVTHGGSSWRELRCDRLKGQRRGARGYGARGRVAQPYGFLSARRIFVRTADGLSSPAGRRPETRWDGPSRPP